MINAKFVNMIRKNLKAIVICGILLLGAIIFLITLKIEPSDPTGGYINPVNNSSIPSSDLEQLDLTGSSSDTDSNVSSGTASIASPQKDASSAKNGSSSKNTSSKKDTTDKSTSSTKPSGGGNGGAVAPPPTSSTNKPSAPKYCTVSIVCDTILKNMDKLTDGLAGYVPKNGVILATIQVELIEGDTAFDVLRRVTRENGIQMEFRDDPTYSGGYIEGINQIYQFDCGKDSGWMYKVNGTFPSYGSGSYKLKDGDDMVWCYTCDLGRDVGDQYYE